MKNISRLNSGYVYSNDIYDEVVKEVLNHQGILFEDVSKNTKYSERFPCVILPRYTDEKYEIARKNCANEDGIIIVEKEIPLNFVLEALSGQLAEPSTDPIHPMINQYEVELLAKIKEKYASLGSPLVRKWFWPSFQNACIVMTHDVDWLYYSPWHRAVLRKKPLLELIKLAYQSVFQKKNYGDNISEIIAKENKAKIRSSFFFLPRYNKNFQKKFLEVLEQMSEKGFEIGLHGYYSHDNVDRLKEQKTTLERYTNIEIKGTRQHELNFLVPLTWKYEEQIGLTYDLTFHYNDKFGFRSGLCFPYHPMDRYENKRFSILEMPTSFMDWTVLFRKMNYEEALQIFFTIGKAVEKYNGLLLTCFHNTYQNKEAFPEIEKLYSTILDFSVQKSYWVTTASECCSWWLKREKTKIDAVIKGRSISGKTETYPFPMVVESANGERKLEEIQSRSFRFNLG